ncbi:hypothetical protein PE066_02220 [Ramlibacter tataouinensis]|uniref:hypothetical protein n=1 Tax=Ramlibacter tataouinensis TaxID=94132 RepID=UPI0022F3EAA5|nr:hypothetical protein [Ramlibacter tataouinensis]WBY02370.1 hypothetical protein PE066_02220 [Ramlibacter tataouinensis]
MFAAVWILGLLALLLWSLTMWGVHALWAALADTSWDVAVNRLPNLQLPPALEPWLGDTWRQWMEAIGPWLGHVAPTLDSITGWAASAMPVLIWITWAIGAFLLLLVTAAFAGVVSWLRGRRRPVART